MRFDRAETLSVDLLQLLFPVAAAVIRPLERQLMHRPDSAELRRLTQDGPEDLALHLGHVRLTGWAPDGKIQETGPRRLYRRSYIPHSAQVNSRQAPSFESSSDQSDGPMALRSKRQNQDEIDFLLVEFFLDPRHDVVQKLCVECNRPNHGNGVGRELLENALLFQLD